MKSMIIPIAIATVVACSKPIEPTHQTSNFDDSKQIVKAMGFGANLGNTFDLKANPATFGDAKKVINLYMSAGAKHIRIPTTWMDSYDGDHLADANGILNSDHPRLKELEKIIQYCIQQNLFVILNAHHEGWLKKSYDGSDAYDSKFRTLWVGIANKFKYASNRLIFEVLNEPEGTMGQWAGPVKPYDGNAIPLTRQINEVGYQAIRSTGGLNKNRLILVMPNGQGNQYMLEAVYPSAKDLPGQGKDPMIAVSVHTYDPWEFCGQDGTNAKYPGFAKVKSGLDRVIAHAAKLGVGIHYGEYGVGRDKDQSLRDAPEVREYYRTVTQIVLGAGGSCTPWDDRGWFGLIEKSGDGYQFKFNLVPDMLK
jgi:endoglucanase